MTTTWTGLDPAAARVVATAAQLADPKVAPPDKPESAYDQAVYSAAVALNYARSLA